MAPSTRPTRSGSDNPERWNDRAVSTESDERLGQLGRSERPPRRRPLAPPEDGNEPDRPAASPGERLRAARLRRRLSLTEAEQATRIRARYLQALEDDDYAALPSGVYSRGFLRNYAIFLGVPPDEVMAAMPERRRRDRRPGVRSVATPVKVSAPRSIWLVAAATAGVLVLIALIWLGLSAPDGGAQGGQGAQSTGGGTGASPGSTPAGGAVVQLPTLPAAQPTLGPTQTPPATPTATLTPGVHVELRTTERAWVRATVDGNVILEETLPAGQTLRWTGQQSVLLRVGNGGGVDVTFNGQRVGALGPPGQPVDREFRR